MEYILKLGSVDVSKYVESGYKTDIEPVYDSGSKVQTFGHFCPKVQVADQAQTIDFQSQWQKKSV